ncbi:sphingomyelin phosphodiesterase 5-like [Lissotriton helveticus]
MKVARPPDQCRPLLVATMVLRQSPFPNGCLHGLHGVSWALIFPCYWFLERFLSSFKETTLEKKRRQSRRCSLHPLPVVLGTTAFLVLLVLSMPIALVGFIFWLPLQAVRRPFSYRHNQPQDAPKEWSVPENGRPFIFVSANLCLLPDGLARFSNLCHTQRRSAVIGKSIVQGVTREQAQTSSHSPKEGILNQGMAGTPQYGAINTSPDPPWRGPDSPSNGGDARGVGEETQPVDPVVIAIDLDEQHVAGDVGFSREEETMQEGNHLEENIGEPRALSYSNPCLDSEDSAHSTGNHAVPEGWCSGDASGGAVRCDISPLVPAGADFVCLQEVFDKRAANRLSVLLSPVYEHILYDVGVYGPLGCSDFKFFNSGLFLASRYAILTAQYRHFANGSGEDALAAKGLLCVKVLVGVIGEKRIVGYMNCTHLHAPEADGHIRCAQLTTLLTWITDFQEKNTSPTDLVAFDVLCGDFNFDNCSTDDHLEQKHEVFGCYKDPCRAGPRKDQEWAIGTLLQQQMLYDDAVYSAQSLQRTLEKEEGRRKYIAPPINPDGTPDDSDTGATWTGRRIDYILYREGRSSSLKTEVQKFTFITHLAGLTDHLAVALRLLVTFPSEDP